MKIYLLGTCSGTEPMPGRNHLSWVLEKDGRLYWFDAGESCSHTGHLLGLKLTEIKAIFISHPHIDHLAGMPKLLWCMHKLDSRHIGSMEGKTVDVFLPSQNLWPCLMNFIKAMGDNILEKFTLTDKLIMPGVIFDDGAVRVEALRNRHLKTEQSFSFRIRSEGKTIVFSGDVKSIEELTGWLDDGCDLFFMETGHHKVADICEFVKARPQVKRLVFVHHGREILEHYEDALLAAQSALGDGGRVEIGYDREIIDL
ncbi:MAG: MBL fold metallo-hydrolase [Lentisphaeria bacterium]|nr:MBL fold metallo-hydrolase [Lentisphaeria bacterium]